MVIIGFQALIEFKSVSIWLFGFLFYRSHIYCPNESFIFCQFYCCLFADFVLSFSLKYLAFSIVVTPCRPLLFVHRSAVMKT